MLGGGAGSQHCVGWGGEQPVRSRGFPEIKSRMPSGRRAKSDQPTGLQFTGLLNLEASVLQSNLLFVK